MNLPVHAGYSTTLSIRLTICLAPAAAACCLAMAVGTQLLSGTSTPTMHTLTGPCVDNTHFMGMCVVPGPPPPPVPTAPSMSRSVLTAQECPCCCPSPPSWGAVSSQSQDAPRVSALLGRVISNIFQHAAATALSDPCPPRQWHRQLCHLGMRNVASSTMGGPYSLA